MNQYAKYLPVISVVALAIAFVLLITSLLVARSIQVSVEAADPSEPITALNGGDDLSAEQVAAIETANAQVMAAAEATATASAIVVADGQEEGEEDSAEITLTTPVPSIVETDEPTSEPEPTDTTPDITDNLAADSDGPRVINAPYTIYKNTLARGWENRSFDGSVNFNGFPAYDGLTAMNMSFSAADGGIYLYSPTAINVESYNVLRFFINGGSTGGQQIAVALIDENERVLQRVPLTPPYPNNWRQVDITLEELGDPTAIHGLQFIDLFGDAQPIFFVDELAFVDDPLSGTFGSNEINGPKLTIDLGDKRHAISKFIYGMNWADESTANLIDLPFNRWGGNAVTRYNWQVDASNTGNNWFFENIPPEDPSPNLPRGSSADQFVQQNIRTETETMLTLPMIGWVARADYTCGFSEEIYGDQVETDQWRPECGTGVLVDGTVITDVNPANTSIPIDPAFDQGWMRHLNGEFGAGDDGGVRFYNLDNEPMLWSHTHRDIRGEDHVGTTELIERTIAYASAAKQVDPTGMLVGPVLWGWSAYFWSGIDVYSGYDPKIESPDQDAHGGIPLVAYYLQQMQQHEEETGVRILDYFDLHFYPQGIGVAFNEAGDPNLHALRLRSTRALWDPTYVDESWIADTVMLIPRMREWRDTYYPGTKLAITEYNWGGLESINGALAQADVLGIFGREALDMAALWSPPGLNSPGMFAFRMYRNYDGRHAKFGDLSIHAESEDQDQVSVYAAERTEDGVYTIMVINKTTVPLTSEVVLDGYDGEALSGFRYSGLNLGAIERIVLPQPEANETTLVETFPPHSITLIVVGATD